MTMTVSGSGWGSGRPVEGEVRRRESRRTLILMESRRTLILIESRRTLILTDR